MGGGGGEEVCQRFYTLLTHWLRRYLFHVLFRGPKFGLDEVRSFISYTLYPEDLRNFDFVLIKFVFRDFAGSIKHCYYLLQFDL